jgi:hypothetical protein
MAKKKKVKLSRITTQDEAKAHVKRIGVDVKGLKECFVCEDGNVFTAHTTCRTHSLSRDIKYFIVEL